LKGRQAKLPANLASDLSETELDEIECDFELDNGQELHLVSKQLDLLIGRLANKNTDKNLYMAMHLEG
jgi:hypothetical protein